MLFIVSSLAIASEKNIELIGGTAACKLAKDNLSGSFTFTGGEFQTAFQSENVETKNSKKIKVEFEKPLSIPLVFEFKHSNVGKPNEVIGTVIFEKGTKTGFADIPEQCKKSIPYMHIIHMGYDDTLVPGEEVVVKIKGISLSK